MTEVLRRDVGRPSPAGAGGRPVRLIHHLTSTEQLGSRGPGWEYYLDMLTASRTDGPRPDFEDYYPAQKAYFESLA
ncbi:hypothetical protein [Streptomyces sp. WAC04114]|uniref:hypothetical protein n=1 Tax=Streptomyces sp. WAC04114 TaxID=2867961 RepID=UPI0021AB4EDB|nr:hypothetical protein [Streptomyces sp. WAC04114]